MSFKLIWFTSGKNIICFATYATILQIRNIKVVEKLGQKKIGYMLRFLENRNICPIFFIKSRLHSYITFKTHESIFCFQNVPYLDISSFISSSSSTLFFKPWKFFFVVVVVVVVVVVLLLLLLLQPLTSSKPTKIVSSSSSSNPTQLFRALFF